METRDSRGESDEGRRLNGISGAKDLTVKSSLRTEERETETQRERERENMKI